MPVRRKIQYVKNPDKSEEVWEVEIPKGFRYVKNVHPAGGILSREYSPSWDEEEVYSKATKRTYHIRYQPDCNCCITVSYSYPQYVELTRYIREHYLAGKKVYKLLRQGNNSLSYSIIQRAESSNFWRIVVKHLIAKPIVKTALSIKNNRLSLYMFPFSLLLLILLLWNFIRRTLPYVDN